MRRTVTSDTRGATSLEYLVLGAVVGLASLAVFLSFGNAIEGEGGAGDGSETDSDVDPDRGGWVEPVGGGRHALGSNGGSAPRSAIDTPSEAAAALSAHYDEISRGDDRIRREHLETVAGDRNASSEAREVARYLLDNEAVRHAVDIGSGGGEVDDEISRQDIEGAREGFGEMGWGEPTPGVEGAVDTPEEAQAVRERYAFLLDGAAGRGGRNDHVSHDDWGAISQSEGLPGELYEAALVMTAQPEEDSCSGFSLCHFGNAARGALDFGTGVAVGFGRGIWETGKFAYNVAELSLRVQFELTLGRTIGYTPTLDKVQSGVESFIDDPRGSLSTAWDVTKAVGNHYVDIVRSCTTQYTARGCGESVGEIGFEAAMTVATGGAGALATRAGRVGTFAARHLDDGARTVRALQGAERGLRALDDVGSVTNLMRRGRRADPPAAVTGPAARVDPPRADLPEPALDYSGWRSRNPAYARFDDSSLYGARTAPSPTDIRQGAIADCYLMASLEALCRANPDFVAGGVRMVDDAFEVRLFSNSGAARHLQVSRSFPAENGQVGRWLAAGPGDDPHAAWAMAAEKAFALDRGGYGAIGNGGSVADAMEAFTGVRSHSYSASTVDLNGLALHQERGHAMAVLSLGKGAGRGRPLYEAGDLVEWHAYSVKHVDADAGTVTLSNPWGPDVPDVTLTIDEFRDNLGQLVTNPVQ